MKKLLPTLLLTAASMLPARAAHIYWVSFHADDNTPSAAAATAGFTAAPDIAYTRLLREKGHTVTRVVSGDAPDTALLNGADLVIISRSVPSGHYELDAETAAWNGITAPTMILGGYILRNNRLGFTAGTTIPDTAGSVSLKAMAPEHPIFAGITLGADGTMANAFANLATFTNNPQRGISVNNSTVAGGGRVIGTVANAGDPAVGGMVIGEWRAGSRLATSPADVLGGHRLVFLTGSREQVITSEGSGIYDLTADGEKMFLNAVSYMTGGQGWKLIAITGQQGDDTPGSLGGFTYPDNTLFEVDQGSAAITRLFRTTWVPDSQSIGYNPLDGLLYHTAGAGAYRDDPLRAGHEQGGPDIPGLAFQDNFYVEKINLLTQVATGVLNANPCPNPDPELPCFGLAAPIPGWKLPEERRNSSQIESTNRVRGTNEYSALRGMAWSTNKNLFYVTDDEGIFMLTPEGESTFLARPAFPTDGKNNVSKGIAFVTVTNVTKLLVGHRDGAAEKGYLMELNPETGEVLGELALTYPPNGGEPADEFGGLLGLTQHPVTGVLYGIRKTGDNFGRELVTINPLTGATTLVGNMGMHTADIVFVPVAPAAAPLQIQSVARNGTSLTIGWSGGTPPYQVQRRSSLGAGAWANDAAAVVTGTSATVTIAGDEGYFRIQGQ